MPMLGLTLAAALLDVQLAVHLAAWEKHARAVTRFKAEFTLTRKDAVFQKPRKYSGAMLGLTSGSVRVRLTNDDDKDDYEAFICDGKSLFFYSGLERSVTEFRLRTPEADPAARKPLLPGDPPDLDSAPAWLKLLLGRLQFEPPTEWLGFRLLAGTIARDAAKRFRVSLHSADENYVYLDFRPRLPTDLQEFESARVALYGPQVKAPHVPYAPAAVYVVKPNGDSESWKFADVRVNVPEIDEKTFQFEEVAGFVLKKVLPIMKPTPGRP